MKRLTCCLLLLTCLAARAERFFEDLGDALTFQSSNGWFSAKLSGLIDVEEHYVDQLPPGLLFANDGFFFNPRLSLFLDTQWGKHFYSLVQVRVDKGFDPGSMPKGDARFDEYLLRYTPFDEPSLNVQVGKFATVFGNWIPRHLSWDNPFINAPLPYENVLIAGDGGSPAGPGAFLARRGTPDKKALWLPQIWGASYASGASIFGRVEKFDYALEIKNASLSSRPYFWDATAIQWDHPTFTGRLGYRPSPSWNFGASASYGSYLIPGAPTPAGSGVGDFNQTTVGADASFAWRRWQIWAEAMASRFEVPNVGNADMFSYYLETKYKITTKLFAAVRWNQQFFGKVPDGAGGSQAWDADIWRTDIALGWRFTRNVQTKVQYSYSHQLAALQQGEQLVGAQLTIKF